MFAALNGLGVLRFPGQSAFSWMSGPEGRTVRRFEVYGPGLVNVILPASIVDEHAESAREGVRNCISLVGSDHADRQ